MEEKNIKAKIVQVVSLSARRAHLEFLNNFVDLAEKGCFIIILQ